MFKTRKKHFAIFGFCLFFDDVIIFGGNFGEFPICGNLAISKRCHVLSHNSAISWPIWLKFDMVIPDIILLTLVSQFVQIRSRKRDINVERSKFRNI